MKTIITASLTGAISPKEKNSAIPCTPKEIAEDAVRVWKEGASVVHLHMRDEKNQGSMDHARFRETVQRIRDNTDIVINLTTSGKVGVTDDERIGHVIELKPELATFDAGSINFLPDGIFDNTAGFLSKIGKIMIENGVKPEVEIMDVGMLYAVEYYKAKGILLDPVHYQFVMGFFSGIAPTPENLLFMLDKIPEGSTWSAFGIGTGHMPILYTAIAKGGHVRVGLEDNIYYAKGQLATNSMLVARAARAIREFGNEVATPEEARKILGVNK